MRVDDVAGNFARPCKGGDHCGPGGGGGGGGGAGGRGGVPGVAAGRGLHSSTFRLNVSTLSGIGGALRRCLGVV